MAVSENGPEKKERTLAKRTKQRRGKEREKYDLNLTFTKYHHFAYLVAYVTMKFNIQPD